MPFIEMTMIAGYGPDVKQRLVTGLTRAVRSVVAAVPEAVIVVLREVEPANWARGGQSRIPGPPLPAAADVVRSFAKAAPVARAGLLGADARIVIEPVIYSSLEEAPTDDGVLVFAIGGSADGRDVLDRYHVQAGCITDAKRWYADRSER